MIEESANDVQELTQFLFKNTTLSSLFGARLILAGILSHHMIISSFILGSGSWVARHLFFSFRLAKRTKQRHLEFMFQVHLTEQGSYCKLQTTCISCVQYTFMHYFYNQFHEPGIIYYSIYLLFSQECILKYLLCKVNPNSLQNIRFHLHHRHYLQNL